jgi:hypothetical protein
MRRSLSPRALALALLILPALGLGCDRRMEPWVDPADEPAGSEKPVRIPGIGQPVGQPMPERPASGVAGESIRGTLRLADGVAVPQGAVLFVIARSASGGPPLAVKRLVPGAFPTSFEIGPQDAMMEGRPFEGAILLSARIDADGDPLTRGPEDLAASVDSPVEPGASGVELTLTSPR